MRRTRDSVALVTFAALLAIACDDSPVERHAAPGDGVLPVAGKSGETDTGGSEAVPNDEPSEAGAGGAGDVGGSAGAPSEETGGTETTGGMLGTELEIAVNADTATFVNLEAATAVEVDAAHVATSTTWDLSFRGWDIFTNGGASGGGKGAAFGPLPFTYFAAASDPTEVPFLIEDKPAGAFRDWYFYDGQWHSLYSRFHVYGIKSGTRLFKLQVLGYYGDVQGAPISALYRLRYAEVTPDSSGEVSDIANLDGTAGGLGGNDDSTSGSLALATGEMSALTPREASESQLWDLSFRRDSISINGGLGGPGDVTAVDLDAEATEGEKLDAIKALTPENQAERFAAIDYGALTAPARKYRGDRVVSAFSDAWIDLSNDSPTLADDNTWLVVSADGKSRFLLALNELKHATSAAPGRVVMRIVKVR